MTTKSEARIGAAFNSAGIAPIGDASIYSKRPADKSRGFFDKVFNR